MKNKTAVVSLSLEQCAQSSGTRLFKLSGDNTGNLLFTAAVYSHLQYPEHIKGQDKPEELHNRYDQICIPAANWIFPRFEFGWLADILEKAQLPVCCVGLGTQVDESQTSMLTQGTLRFLHVLSDQSTSIGVRGSLTAELMNKLGIKNVEVIGCPSLFQSFQVPSIKRVKNGAFESVGGSFTRYALSPKREDFYQQSLARFLFEFADKIYFQSEIEEIRYLAGECELESNLAGFYNQSQEVVGSVLKKKGRCFNSIEAWLKDLQDCSAFYTSRIHGSVAATLAGCPSILLTHDHRTRELAESMVLANIPIEQADFSSFRDPEWFSEQVAHYETAGTSWIRNRKRLVGLYETNNVPIIDFEE
ncbi:polysaccharide pyruvyl transferase family protein [Pseudomonadota bacterium]